MNQANVGANRMDLHRRIALVLRKEPGRVRDFAERLRSKLAMARSAAVVSDNEWEWYIILTLWSPQQCREVLGGQRLVFDNDSSDPDPHENRS
jgi:hypothetical protein